MRKDRSPRWPFGIVWIAVLLYGALGGAGAGLLSPFGAAGWRVLGHSEGRMGTGAILGLLASWVWWLAMTPRRLGQSRTPDRELPWHVFWGMFWGLVLWSLIGAGFALAAIQWDMWGRWGWGYGFLLWTFAGFGTMGLVGGTVGGFLVLAAEKLKRFLRSRPESAPEDPAARARAARRRRKVGLIVSGAMVVLGALGLPAGLVVPLKRLDVAIAQDDVAEVRKHLFWARDAEMPLRDGDTALYRAITERSGRVARMLIEGGANVNAVCWGRCCLSAAAMGTDESLARLLIAKGANVDGPRPLMVRPPLHAAAAYGHAQMVRILLDAGADINLLSSRPPLSPLAEAIVARMNLPLEVIRATGPAGEGEADDDPDGPFDPERRQQVLEQLEGLNQTIQLLVEHGAKMIPPPGTQPASQPGGGPAGP